MKFAFFTLFFSLFFHFTLKSQEIKPNNKVVAAFGEVSYEFDQGRIAYLNFLSDSSCVFFEPSEFFKKFKNKSSIRVLDIGHVFSDIDKSNYLLSFNILLLPFDNSNDENYYYIHQLDLFISILGRKEIIKAINRSMKSK